MSEETITTDGSSDSASRTADAPADSREPNSRKIKLRRIMHSVPKLEDGKPLLDDKQQPILITEPAVLLTQASVPNGASYDHVILSAGQNEFEFSAGDAAYLVREHPDALEPVPDAPTKLKSKK